jgi:putative DNA methylase
VLDGNSIHESLLDAGNLPVESLAALAVREGWRPVPIYQAHRWFARRFSSAFRAILVSAKITNKSDFWDAFYNGVDYEGTTVLDPFVGGGTSVVEASQLGANTIGVDIDPVACAITQFELNAATVPDLHPTMSLLKHKVGSKILPFYRTKGPNGDTRQILHAFWVQVVRCHVCGRTTEAHPSYQLAYDKNNECQWTFCSFCHLPKRVRIDAKSFTCSACRTKTNIFEGPVTHGRFQCGSCYTEENLIDVASRTGTPPVWRLFALETIPSGQCNLRVPMSGRDFQSASSADRRKIASAKKAIEQIEEFKNNKSWIPNRQIPRSDRADDRLIRYGYRQYRDLFNPRQLFHLATLAKAIDELKGSTRDAFALAFSDHLTTNCMMTHYAFGWRRLSPLFSIRAYRHVCRPVEINPWLDGTGRGTFPNSVRQVGRAVSYAQSPQLAHLDGGFVPCSTRMAGDTSRSKILVQSSRELAGIKSSSVDMILTDPPYCDNIAYSELSDFYLPWLQLLGVANSKYSSPARTSTLAARTRGVSDIAVFSEGLSDCFLQMRRVLRPHGRLVFSYQHRTPDAWFALARALKRAGMSSIQVFPMLGNSPAGLHQHEGTVLWDAVLVFRKGNKSGGGANLCLSDSQLTSATKHASAWAKRLHDCNYAEFKPVDHENLLRGTLVAASLGMFDKPVYRGRPLFETLASPK